MSEYVKLDGSFKWTKVDPTNPEPPFGTEKGGKWSTVFYPDVKSLEIIRELQVQGMKNVLKRDNETNEYNIKFSRPCARYDKDGEKKIEFTAPKLTGASPKEVGNGSLGNLTLEVYEHAVPGSQRKAKAARLYAIDITRLTPRTQNV